MGARPTVIALPQPLPTDPSRGATYVLGWRHDGRYPRRDRHACATDRPRGVLEHDHR